MTDAEWLYGVADEAWHLETWAPEVKERLRRIAARLEVAGETWCPERSPRLIHDMRRPITEEWLIANGFRQETGRNDPRFPVRSIRLGDQIKGGRPMFGSADDLCIDIAPTAEPGEWFVWVAQREPYRHIHVRCMRETHEIVRLYEGLTGCLWPGIY